MALAMQAGTLMQLPSASPLAPSGGERRRRLLVQHLDRRDFAHGRHQIIGERAGEERAVLVGDVLLVERRGDALRECAAHLAVGDQRIEDFASVVHRHVAVDAHLVGDRVDLDAAHVEHEAVGHRRVDAVVARRRRELRRRPDAGLGQRRRHALGQHHRRPVRGAGDAVERDRVVGVALAPGSCRRPAPRRAAITLSCLAPISLSLSRKACAAMCAATAVPGVKRQE